MKTNAEIIHAALRHSLSAMLALRRNYWLSTTNYDWLEMDYGTQYESEKARDREVVFRTEDELATWADWTFCPVI